MVGVVGCCSGKGVRAGFWDLPQEGSDMSGGKEIDVCMLCWGRGRAGWVLSCPPQLLPHSTDAKVEATLSWGYRAWIWVWVVPGWRREAVGVGTWTWAWQAKFLALEPETKAEGGGWA